MLKYLVILLDDKAASYCYYEPKGICNEKHSSQSGLIGLQDLKEGIRFAMLENLNIQFVYPNFDLPQEYKELIHSIDHSSVRFATSGEQAEVYVIEGFEMLHATELREDGVYVLRCKRQELMTRKEDIKASFGKIRRLNVVFTDMETFDEKDFELYKEALIEFADALSETLKTGQDFQFNLLTDRVMLKQMNNCEAGIENITLAPNGKFYLCPAFYYENADDCIGTLSEGLDIKNRQLLKLKYAPLCRVCDCYQCKRCVWLNRRLTLEVNTPSHAQCVVSHLERNASKYLIEKTGLNAKEIKEIDYLDPFDVRVQW